MDFLLTSHITCQLPSVACQLMCKFLCVKCQKFCKNYMLVATVDELDLLGSLFGEIFGHKLINQDPCLFVFPSPTD